MNYCFFVSCSFLFSSNSNGFTRPEKFFGTGRKRYIDHHFFMSFSLRECISRQNWKSVYPGKNGMRISGQVYYTKNYKKTDFTNLGYHIRGEMMKNWPVRKTSIWILFCIKKVQQNILIFSPHIKIFLEVWEMNWREWGIKT